MSNLQDVDLSVEQSLLGTLLTYPRAMHVAADLLPEHFRLPLHSRIYADMSAMSGRGEIPSPIVLIQRFAKDDGLEGVPSARYFAGLLGLSQQEKGVYYLKQQVKDDATRRALVEAANEIAEASSVIMAGETAADVVSFALDKINGIATQAGDTRKKTRFSILDAVDGVTTRVNDVLQHGVLPDDCAPCASKLLSEAIGGWRRGRLYIIAGRPGMGKTTVAQSWLIEAAKQGAAVAFFSMEMNADELAERALSDLCFSSGVRVEYQWIARNDLRPLQMEALMAAQHELPKLSFTIHDRAGLTMGQIRALAIQEQQRLQANGKRLDVVCIDHIGLMRAADRYSGNKVAETEEISAGLKVLAKELDVAVIALSQLSRQVETRDNKRPMLSDLRWSGSIEQDADVVMLCYRPEYYLSQMRCDDDLGEIERLSELDKAKGKLEIQIAKQRGGATPTLDFKIDAGCAAVRDE